MTEPIQAPPIPASPEQRMAAIAAMTSLFVGQGVSEQSANRAATILVDQAIAGIGEPPPGLGSGNVTEPEPEQPV